MSAASTGAATPSLRRLPFTVRMAAAFVNGLLGRARPDQLSVVNIGGVVFGNFEDGSVQVRLDAKFPRAVGHAPIPPEQRDPNAFEAFLFRVSKEGDVAGLSPVGWFALRESGGLLESDIEFHNQHFSNPNCVAIIVRPDRDHTITFELYSRSADGALSEDAHRWGLVRLSHSAALAEAVEIPMRAQIRDDLFMHAYQLGDASEEAAPVNKWQRALERLRPSRRPDPVLNESTALQEDLRPHEAPWAIVEPPPAPSAALVPKPNLPTAPARVLDADQKLVPASSPNSAYPSAPTVPASYAVPASYTSPRQPRRRSLFWLSLIAVFSLAAAATFAVIRLGLLINTSSAGVPATNAPSPLGLKLEGQGERILVTWNRNSIAARSAMGGTLAIDDGSTHRSLSLDSGQLKNGSVLYTPGSADVTFRLQVQRQDGSSLSETLRVLDASRPPGSQPTPLEPIVPDWKLTPKVPPSTAVRAKTLPAVAANKQPEVLEAAPSSSAYRAQPGTPKDAPASASSSEEAAAQPPTLKVPMTEPSGGEKPQETIAAPNSPTTPSTAVNAPASGVASSFKPPQPRKQVMPNLRVLPLGSPPTSGQVQVAVKIDRTGHVSEASVTSSTRNMNSIVVAASLLAARQWVFEPAELGGQKVPSEHAIIFNFKPQAP